MTQTGTSLLSVRTLIGRWEVSAGPAEGVWCVSLRVCISVSIFSQHPSLFSLSLWGGGGGVTTVKVAGGDRTAAALSLSPPFSSSVSLSLSLSPSPPSHRSRWTKLRGNHHYVYSAPRCPHNTTHHPRPITPCCLSPSKPPFLCFSTPWWWLLDR